MLENDAYKIMEFRLAAVRQKLIAKSIEYSTSEDKLHNFKRAAKINNCSTFKALQGMKAKHDVSILDIIDKLDKGEHVPFELFEEKVTDSIAYLLLLEMLIREKDLI